MQWLVVSQEAYDEGLRFFLQPFATFQAFVTSNRRMHVVFADDVRLNRQNEYKKNKNKNEKMDDGGHAGHKYAWQCTGAAD